MTLADFLFFGGTLLGVAGLVTAVGCLYVLVLMGQNRSYASTREEVEQARIVPFRRRRPYDFESDPMSGPRVLP